MKCPYCQKSISDLACKCPHCSSDISIEYKKYLLQSQSIDFASFFYSVIFFVVFAIILYGINEVAIKLDLSFWIVIGGICLAPWIYLFVFGPMKTKETDKEKQIRWKATLNTTNFTNNETTSKCCPYCTESISIKAVKCKHCQSDLRY